MIRSATAAVTRISSHPKSYFLVTSLKKSPPLTIPILVSSMVRWESNEVLSTTTTTASSTTDKKDPPEKQSISPLYAAVNHNDAYEESLAGRHGNQLALANKVGEGMDDPPFDPFQDDDEEYDEDDDELEEEEEEDIPEGEIVGSDDIDDDGEEYPAEEEEEEEEEVDEMDAKWSEFRSKYNNDGSLRRSRSQLATLSVGAPAGGLFAVINLSGSQQKVCVDDAVIVNKLKPIERWTVGATITLKDEDIMLLGSSAFTLVGMPAVHGAEVDVLVEENTKDAKVIIFKKRRRKNSQRKRGFRRDVTVLRVLDIRVPKRFSDLNYRKRIEPSF